MAETIFGQTPFTSAMEGYAQGVDLQTYKQQQADRASLLSTQAEEGRMRLGAEKQAFATTMAARASLADQSRQADADMSQAQGVLKVYGAAIQANKNNPEVQEEIYRQQQQRLHEMAQAATAQLDIRKEQEAARYDTLRNASIQADPTAALDDAYKKATSDSDKRMFAGLKQLMNPDSTIPFPTSKKPWKDMSPDEQQDAWQQILDKSAPQNATTEAATLARMATARNAQELKRQKDIEDQAYKNKALALKREQGDAVLAEREAYHKGLLARQQKANEIRTYFGNAKNDKDFAIAMAKADQTYPKLIKEVTTNLADAQRRSTNFLGIKNEEAISEAASLQDELNTLNKNYADVKAMYSKKDAVVAQVKKPEAAPVIPPRPANVPAGSQYSPSTKTWWKDGKKVG